MGIEESQVSMKEIEDTRQKERVLIKLINSQYKSPIQTLHDIVTYLVEEDTHKESVAENSTGGGQKKKRDQSVWKDIGQKCIYL